MSLFTSNPCNIQTFGRFDSRWPSQPSSPASFRLDSSVFATSLVAKGPLCTELGFSSLETNVLGAADGARAIQTPTPRARRSRRRACAWPRPARQARAHSRARCQPRPRPLLPQLPHAPPRNLPLPRARPRAGLRSPCSRPARRPGYPPEERDFFIHNLLVRIHLIIEMILVDRPCAMGV